MDSPMHLFHMEKHQIIAKRLNDNGNFELKTQPIFDHKTYLYSIGWGDLSCIFNQTEQFGTFWSDSKILFKDSQKLTSFLY